MTVHDVHVGNPPRPDTKTLVSDVRPVEAYAASQLLDQAANHLNRSLINAFDQYAVG